MSISSVQNPVVFANASVQRVVGFGPTSTVQTQVQPVADLNDAFAGVAISGMQKTQAAGLLAPRPAAMANRGATALPVPQLSADDALDLQDSANLLAQASEAKSGVLASQHKTTMAILRNIAS